MITPKQRNELGDALEIEVVRDRVLGSILPEGFKSKHNPKTVGGPDFLIIQGEQTKLVLECKNWENYSPSDDEIKDQILNRFENLPAEVQKVLVGHVALSQEQYEKYLIKNEILYLGLERQILPDDDPLTKDEFAEKLKTAIAFAILAVTDKLKEECISPMEMTIIGGDEVVFKQGEYVKNLTLRITKDVMTSRHGTRISYLRRVGRKPLDVVFTIKAENEGGSLNSIFVPRKYAINSKNVKPFLPEEYNDMASNPEIRDFWFNKFFRQVQWRNQI